MTKEELKKRGLEKEIHFSFSKSGGKGGQHVNKTESKVLLVFSVPSSEMFSDAEKQIILERLKSRLSQEGDLIISDQHSRSQYLNREKALTKFYTLLMKAFTTPKKRKPTVRTRASENKRRMEKARRKEIKQHRSGKLD
jgi:ribosome-associated protein